MISIFLPGWLTGAIGFVAMILALVCAFALVLVPLALAKILLWPIRSLRQPCDEALGEVMTIWGDLNALAYRLLFPVQWEVDLPPGLDPRRSYLLVCNHQSWIDIVLLVHVLRRRIAPACFFLKRELLWVPVVGAACWAMGFPFMKRHSAEAITRNPALKGEDLETTRRACERFRKRPVTMINFLEGTRFTESKRIEKQSPFRHLLRPKSAGMAFALRAMGDQFAGVIDVTLCYRPSPRPLLWSFLCGEQTQLAVHADFVPVPAEFLAGDYQDDPEFRARFQAWVNTLWSRKDARLGRMQDTPRREVRARPV